MPDFTPAGLADNSRGLDVLLLLLLLLLFAVDDRFYIADSMRSHVILHK